MSALQLTLLSIAVALGVYGAFISWLIFAGRGSEAKALARFIPDCLVLFRRLLSDPRVPRTRKALVVAMVGYLGLPFDLVPDFIPVAGVLDDVLLVALTLRLVFGSCGPAVLADLWSGPPEGLRVIFRLVGQPQPSGAGASRTA
jgi:uncharacterized membrane protein YkvA (DUF1232 family)